MKKIIIKDIEYFDLTRVFSFSNISFLVSFAINKQLDAKQGESEGRGANATANGEKVKK